MQHILLPACMRSSRADHPMPDTFSTRLILARQQAGLTQQQLADKAGILRHSLARLETDVRQPFLSTAQKIATALGKTMEMWEGLKDA